jgi:glycerol kinase
MHPSPPTIIAHRVEAEPEQEERVAVRPGSKAAGDDALVLALDQGGHASRAVLFDVTGREVAEAHVPVDTRRVGTDRVEHDADELAATLVMAVQDVCESAVARDRDIVAAGLACQRSTVVCWDRSDGRALSPALSWQDRRDAGFLDRLRDRAAWIRERTGLVLSPHYGANKLRWCLETLPAVRAAEAAARLAAGPLASFLASRLLEEQPVCADPSNASRTLLFDPATRDWIPELLAAFGVPRGVLPEPVPTRHDYGTLRVGARSIPLTACTGDQAAAVFACGEPAPDQVWLNAGTGAFLQRASAADARAPDGLLKSVLFSDGSRVVYSVEATVNGAASALDWLQSRVALDVGRAMQALPVRAPARAPLFMNGVGGLGSPWWRPDFPIEFCGEGDELAQATAVIESVAFMVAVNLELIRAAGPLGSVLMTGGLARNDYLCQAIADVAALPVERLALREGTARGAAFLAAGAAARWAASPLDRRFTPCASETLVARFRDWRGEMARRGASGPSWGAA